MMFINKFAKIISILVLFLFTHAPMKAQCNCSGILPMLDPMMPVKRIYVVGVISEQDRKASIELLKCNKGRNADNMFEIIAEDEAFIQILEKDAKNLKSFGKQNYVVVKTLLEAQKIQLGCTEPIYFEVRDDQ